MSAFLVEVYTASGARTNGRAYEISRVQHVQRVNAIGEISFDIPAVVAYENGFAVRKKYRVFHSEHGDLGYFRHISSQLNDDGMLTIRAFDALLDLDEITVGSNYQFSDVALASAVNNVTAKAGWTATYPNASGDYYTVSRRLMGDSAFRALSLIAEDQRGWFSLSGINSIRFGRWTNNYKNSASIAAILVNIAQSSAAFEKQRDLVPIEKITVERDATTIVTRIIPTGRGSGESQLDLEYSTRTTPYAKLQRLNPDGKTIEYYLQSDVGITQNGIIERQIQFDVTQVTNSIADRTNAGNVLHDLASAYLDTHIDATINYQISCINPPAALLPGAVVVVDYRAVAKSSPERKGIVVTDTGSTCYERIDMQRMFVVEVSRSFDDATGAVMASLTVSPSGEKISNVVDRIVNALDDVKRFKTHIAPSYSKYTPSSREMSINPSLPFDWYFPLDNDIAEINRMKIYFTLSRLRTDSNNEVEANAVQTTSSDGGTTTTTTTTSAAGGGGTQTSGASSVTTTGAAGSSALTELFTGDGFVFTGASKTAFNLTGAPEFGDTSSVHRHTLQSHYHFVPLPPHTHDNPHTHTVSFQPHSHSVTVTITVPPHTHSVPAHKHPTKFGVFEDTIDLGDVSVWIDLGGSSLVQVTNLKDAKTGQFAGNAVDGPGFYYADVRPLLETIDFHGMRHVQFRCASGHGRVHAQIIGSVTCVPVLAD